ncbi:anthrone oxygenase family protein [Saccharopolyspora sp. NPDC050389]|uniref:anthrone oxygenase family protein n=1 Tax=Saccharopolyspora sp. NPDC050389 TaxID=3155516 RepID=UPI0033F93353
MSLPTATLVAATILTGLSAGLFYGFACAVMPGLRRSDDRTFVTAMRRINSSILNGWFAIGFLGAFVLPVVAAVLHLGSLRLPWIVAAIVLYAGGTLAITFRINVPLNNELEAAGGRTNFESRWVRWNVVRAVSSTGALGCLAAALAAALAA